MAELLLDSNIRFWVFLPIVVITFLIGILRHYITILLSSEKKVELQQITDRYITHKCKINGPEFCGHFCLSGQSCIFDSEEVQLSVFM